MAQTWEAAFDAWWATAEHGWDHEPCCAEHALAKLAYGNGRDCGRAEMQAEQQTAREASRLRAIVNELKEQRVRLEQLEEDYPMGSVPHRLAEALLSVLETRGEHC